MLADERLTFNFRLSEFTNSQLATRFGIVNEPDAEQLHNLRRLAAVMEEVRGHLDLSPILISSGLRVPELNSRLGGARDSAHLYGRAADFTVPSFGDPRAVCKALMVTEPSAGLVGNGSIAFDQLIFEGTWVHLGIAAEGTEPRLEVLTACFQPGQRTTYARGLI